MSDNLVIGGATFSGVTGIKATDTNDNVIIFDSGEKAPSADDYAQGLVPSGLIEINSSSVVAGAFHSCKNITGVVIGVPCTLYENAFKSCSGMTFFVSQSKTTWNAACITSCSKLQTVDIDINTLNKSLGFSQNANMTALVLRKTSSITSVTQTNLFNGSKWTGKPIHVYVPSALKSTYEAATNWSTWVADGTIIFEDLEGSAFESEDWWKS